MRLALKLIATTLALAFSVQRIDGFGFALHSRKPMQELARRNYYHQCFHTQCSHCPSNIDRSSRKYQRTPSTQLAVGVANVDTSAVESLNSIISSSSLSSAVESDGNWNDLISFGGNPASFIYMAETEGWVKPVVTILDPTLNYLAFAMLCRVIISWYPKTNLNEVPFNFVAWPTEPLLKMIRGIIPPSFGVDITPIVWVGVFTFLHEILLGQQGLFTMKLKYGI